MAGGCERHSDKPYVDRYRRLLRRTGSSALESASERHQADLSEAGISERIETADARLRQIIRDYLGDRPDLHQIADRIQAEGPAALRLVASSDEQRLRHNDEARAQLEVIVQADGSRPSFLVRDGKVDRNSSPIGTWSNALDASDGTLREALTCIGRIDDPSELQGFQGTGFLVAEDLIITNRHVLQSIANVGDAGAWSFKPGIKIDFGHEFQARESVSPRALRSVLFCGPVAIDDTAIDHAKLDLAVIELEPASASERPRYVLDLDISLDWPQPAAEIYTVGYPGRPVFGTYTPTLIEQLFKSTFGHKRLAPGLVIPAHTNVEPWTVAHDATTLAGNSGSVVLVAGRERMAAGLHYGGTRAQPRENWAHILGRTLNTQDKVTGKSLREALQDRVRFVQRQGGG